MSDKKSKKPAPEAEAVETAAVEGEEGEAAPKGKGVGLIPMIAAAVVAAGVAGGAAFVLAPGGASNAEICAGENADGAENSDDHGGAHGDDAHDSASDDAVDPCVKAEDAGDKKEKKKAAKSSGGGHGGGDSGAAPVKPVGQVQHSEHATFLVLDPMIVSIQPIGRSKHLKVSLVLETDSDGAVMLLDNGYYIQDVLNTFLRSVDSTVLEDPASMSRLRSQILRRVKSVTPGATVTNVLITEFVLT